MSARADRRRRSRFDWDAIRAVYVAGATMQECQAHFAISNGAWHSAVARGDIVPRPDPRNARARRTRGAVQELLEAGLSQGETARRLGLAKPTVSYHARRLGISADPRPARRYDWWAIQQHYDEGYSFTECAARFGFSNSAWYEAISRGQLIPRPRTDTLAAWLVEGSRVSRFALKARLLRRGLLQHVCEACGTRGEWQGRSLSLNLHHRNGIRDDNRLENLALLCPNCHSQTDTFSGRNGRAPKSAQTT
jgi:5-methylcytosine-specific restriction endonuclease McrA